MCGRYSLTQTEGFTDRFHISNMLQIRSQEMIFPSERMPVIVQQEKNNIELMKWGLIPSWSRDGRSMVINAREETLAHKIMFQPLLKTKRCLVPATGFYEWKRAEGKKTPYYFELKSKDLFAFAGLYDEWKNENNEVIKSYTIITTTPNTLVEKIHNRMPVILKKEYEFDWINSKIKDIPMLLSLLVPYPTDEMEGRPV